jgi:UDPglucose--hexose-1-phosphate uridylyltransferase
MRPMLAFKQETFHARLVLPSGETAAQPIEIRTHPVTGRTCRITFSRSREHEPGAAHLPELPSPVTSAENCPFCKQLLSSHTPRLTPELSPSGRLVKGTSTLFPNLFPYGRYAAVCIFDEAHYVEIAEAPLSSYADGFINCGRYLDLVMRHDPAARFMAITQNHLPAAGGSLVHPHLQVHADRSASNHQRFLSRRCADYRRDTGNRLFSDYLRAEKEAGLRLIGATGPWEWLAAFAPEGFFEIWGIFPGATSLRDVRESHWEALARGVLNAQRFYRSLGRNAYNLGLLMVEDPSAELELRAVLTVRSSYAPWVRNDFTGFEVMLGDMATFTAPELTAEKARPYWL